MTRQSRARAHARALYQTPVQRSAPRARPPAPGAHPPCSERTGAHIGVGGRRAHRALQVQRNVLRTLRPDALCAAHRFPLAPHFVTRLMPAGHIKSSRPDDAPFLAALEPSPKWLRLVADE